MKQDALILVRGGGDLATGTIHRLWSAGLRVLVLETAHPAAIRRQVSLCEAVYEGETTVEGLRAVRIDTLKQAPTVWHRMRCPSSSTRQAAAWHKQSRMYWWMPFWPRRTLAPPVIWHR